MNAVPKNVLILCTGNSARSILAEALLNNLPSCSGKLIGYSAGSHPVGRVNPFALALLAEEGFVTAELRSKSWDEFIGSGAAVMHFVITVCDQAAGEQCPYWPGHPLRAHWGIADPAALAGDDEQKRQAFKDAFATLRRRIELFARLPFEQLEPLELQRRLDEIGRQ
jgi:arsenate reductase (thioredoxin)